jgi:hypothetical protein
MTDFSPDAVLSYDEQIRHYGRVHARLMGGLAQRRDNKPIQIEEVRSEPAQENIFADMLRQVGQMAATVDLSVPDHAPAEPAPTPERPVVAPLVRFVIEHVAAFYGVAMVDMASARREARIVKPRQIAMYLARLLTVRSLPEIGRLMGGKDHTTVLYGARKVADDIQASARLAAEVAELTRRIEAGEPVPAPAPKPHTLPARIAKPKRRKARKVRECDLPPKIPFWNERRDAELTRFWYEGVLVEDIGERFGKSPSAIRDRAHKIGLPLRRGHWQEIVREVKFS